MDLIEVAGRFALANRRARPMAVRHREVNPRAMTQLPRGSSQSDVETPKPIMARPTTQVGVEQQTTQDIVALDKATSAAPKPVVALAWNVVPFEQVRRCSRRRTMFVATKAPSRKTIMTL